MPKAIIDLARCQPQRCEGGKCQAKKTCSVKALWQEEPYAVPFLSGGRCNGCAKCVAACPLRAIVMS